MSIDTQEVHAGHAIHRELALYDLGVRNYSVVDGHREWALDMATDPDLNAVNIIEFVGSEPYLRVHIKANKPAEG